MTKKRAGQYPGLYELQDHLNWPVAMTRSMCLGLASCWLLIPKWIWFRRPARWWGRCDSRLVFISEGKLTLEWQSSFSVWRMQCDNFPLQQSLEQQFQFAQLLREYTTNGVFWDRCPEKREFIDNAYTRRMFVESTSEYNSLLSGLMWSFFYGMSFVALHGNYITKFSPFHLQSSLSKNY